MSGQRSSRERFEALVAGLTVPVVAAPMFLVSGPELVIAACRSGIVGAFPAPNARTTDDLAAWLEQIVPAVESAPAPWAVNLVAHRTYDRLDDELKVLDTAAPPLVITALGSPRRAIHAVHEWGGLLLADVSNLEQAQRAIDAGVDGLVVVCAGSGGHTGRYTPFALVPEIRRRWDGPLIAGGAVSTGGGVVAMRALGADLAYVGTRLLATAESLAPEGHQRLVVESNIDDIVTSDAVTGVPANWLRPSLKRRDAADQAAAPIDFSGDIAAESKAWRDVWSAGHGVGAVRAIEPIADVVTTITREYRSALAAMAGPADVLEETG